MPDNRKRAKDYWDRLLSKNISNLFTTKLSLHEKMNIFKNFVEMVNIETSTKCNRHCNYCPLSINSRGEIDKKLDNRLFHKTINELMQIDYNGSIGLNLYNEPLLDVELENNISYIKTSLPSSYILLNSNGDYLTTDRLEKLAQVGLNELRVTLHGNTYKDERKLKEVDKFFLKLGIEYKIDKYIPNETIYIKKSLGSLKLIVMCNNWAEIGNDRVGSIDKLIKENNTRQAPCMKPFRELVISAEGNSFPCCNFFPDSEKAKRFTLGNVSKDSIFDIYSSSAMVGFRKALFTFSDKLNPCNTCNDIDNATLESNEKRIKILKKLGNTQ